MVSEPDHSSFQSDILKKYLSDLQIFPVMKTLFATLSNLFISNFEKSNHDQSWSSLFHLSANQNLENKVKNIIQHTE